MAIIVHVNVHTLQVGRSDADADPGSSSEWVLRINVNGEEQTFSNDYVRDRRTFPMNMNFMVSLPDPQSNLRISASGYEEDDWTANDDLPYAERMHTEGGDWGIGGDFELTGSNEEFSYRIGYRIRDVTPPGQSLTNPDGPPPGPPAMYQPYDSSVEEVVSLISAEGGLFVFRSPGQWKTENVARATGGAARFLRFRGIPDVSPRYPTRDRDMVVATTTDGRLALFTKRDRWEVAFPAGNRRFASDPQLLSAAVARKVILATSPEGQLVQLANAGESPPESERWSVTAPRETRDLKLRGVGCVLRALASADGTRKHIFTTTRDGRLVWIRDVDGWKVSYPAERISPEPKFGYPPAVLRHSDTQFSLFAITRAGRLANLEWDAATNAPPQISYPVEEAGGRDLRFLGRIAAYHNHPQGTTVVAVTGDGRIVQARKGDRWRHDFPAELAGETKKFRKAVAMRLRDDQADKKSIYAIDVEGRLTRLWDTNRWNVERLSVPPVP